MRARAGGRGVDVGAAGCGNCGSMSPALEVAMPGRSRVHRAAGERREAARLPVGAPVAQPGRCSTLSVPQLRRGGSSPGRRALSVAVGVAIVVALAAAAVVPSAYADHNVLRTSRGDYTVQFPPYGGPAEGPQAYNDVEEHWEFDDGLNAWANSSAEQMDAEVFARGGEMRLRIRGAKTNVDSPLFFLNASDDFTIVIRMMTAARSTKANFKVRLSDGTVPPASYATGDPVWKGANIIDLDFDIIPDRQYHTYYVPLYNFRNPTPVVQNIITQLRLHPLTSSASLLVTDGQPPPDSSARLGQSVWVDYIRIAKQPTITSVLNCAFLPEKFKGNEIYPVHPAGLWVRPHGPLNQWFAAAENATKTRYVGSDTPGLPYGITYNCLPRGGERIMLVGRNFGVEGARVTVGGRPCTSVIHETPQTHVSCITPPGTGDKQDVSIANGNMPGLRDTRPYLSYAVGPFATRRPTISNIAARSVHINWRASDDWWDSLTITGFKIQRRHVTDDSDPFPLNWKWGEWGNEVSVGNVSVTTLIGLTPDTHYQFRIAPMSENVVFHEQWQELDLYGRRPPVDGFVIGEYGEPTVRIQTLKFDFVFNGFDANSTLDHGAADKRNSSGQLGLETGEGHYGLVMVGDANIQNCNASSTCCDKFSSLGAKGCTLSCSARASYRPLYVNEKGFRDSDNEPPRDDRWVPKGVPGPDVTDTDRPRPLPTPRTNFANGITVGPRSDLARAPTYDCGPALRLTASQARLTGAVWYSRQMQVREGFDTTFTFSISNPSTICKFMDDVYTRCRSRGGDGFAFVIQNQHPAAMGNAGGDMGYGGIINSVAVEFDTYLNPENLDPMENHVSVQTRGWRHANSPNHTYEIGSAVQAVPLLDDLVHTVQITYTPNFNVESLQDVSWLATPHMADFLQDGDYSGGGMGSWGTGVGSLRVFFNGQKVPALTVPLNLEDTLKLNNGRAWVGFTAGTGDSVYQTHDLLYWDFTMNRDDWAANANAFPPEVVNEVGKFECSGFFECVHPPASPTGRSKQKDNKFVNDKDTPY